MTVTLCGCMSVNLCFWICQCVRKGMNVKKGEEKKQTWQKPWAVGSFSEKCDAGMVCIRYLWHICGCINQWARCISQAPTFDLSLNFCPNQNSPGWHLDTLNTPTRRQPLHLYGLRTSSEALSACSKELKRNYSALCLYIIYPTTFPFHILIWEAICCLSAWKEAAAWLILCEVTSCQAQAEIEDSNAGRQL